MKKTALTVRQKHSRKINRQRALRRRVRVLGRRFFLAFVVGAILISGIKGWWFWRPGALAVEGQAMLTGFWRTTAQIGFHVTTITVEGPHATPRADIVRALGVTTSTPSLAVSLEELQAKLLTLPRVREAEVTRILPGELRVRVFEREPMAVWQNDGTLQLIDKDGVAMDPVAAQQYRQLPLVVGRGAPAHALELLEVVAETPALAAQVASLIRIGERRWNVRFKNGLELKLPEQGMKAAWLRFSELEAQHHLLGQGVQSVDMRLADRIFILPAAPLPSDAKPSGHET